MSDPVVATIPKNTWTKVATNVTAGSIHKLIEAPQGYLQTYRDTGGVAPTLIEEGAALFEKSRSELISAKSGIDVYVYALNVGGKVRVDL